MRNILFAILVHMIAFPIYSWADQNAGDKRLLGISVPSKILDFVIKKEINNEVVREGLGYTLYYNAVGVKASLYIYNLGYKKLPQGIDSDIINEHFNQINNDVIRYNPLAQKIVDGEKLSISGIPVLHSVFFYTEQKTGLKDPIFSHSYLASIKGQFVKLRVSYSAENQPKKGHGKHVIFVDQLFKYIAENT